ncbi:ATP-binding protein [Ancylobacter sp. 6x-1]|uniref:ATP-binding protein n=1 Tax=Ancylobacter crimeensis TaxID=2579147 RepID=A0ABT0D755_9HYPH|nr:ATP-binding protein [Ancylobacter crimeensis]MCK0195788.1 ATP-binding protein [Ancylobacter crimeensis]
MATFGSADIMLGATDDISRIQLFDGPLEIGWHHCAMTADFVGELFAIRVGEASPDYREIRHSIGYLVNELIENAVKFRAPGIIAVEAAMRDGTFRVKVSNQVDRDTAARFQGLILEITDGDPGDLLIRRIEANAADPTYSGSGLGLLTLMSDYGARLAWVFNPSADGSRVFIETHAILPVVAPVAH